jgi:N-6 DNA Methylase
MTTFPSLSIVGGLLPGELFTRVANRGEEVPAMAPESYGLERSESVQRQAARCWPYLQDIWKEFKERKDKTAETHWQRLTRERWLQILLRELGFTHLKANGGFELEGKRFPVSHRSNGIPIHLLAWQTNLDHRTKGLAGAARAPHSMMQELLNRSDECLWAILSNGSRLRLLRDSTSLAGSAYVEFDLEAIFDGELFSDFRLLYLVCHSSRFDAVDTGGPSSCPLEAWRGFAADIATRALSDLRAGVETAVSTLGTGLLSHPSNGKLRQRIITGDLDMADFNHALLRVIYRLLFWFVVEDRDVLIQPFPEDADETTLKQLRLTRERYLHYFSSARLRRLARMRQGKRYTDLWEGIQVVFTMLGDGYKPDVLSLPGLGGIFETSELDAPLDNARLGNNALLHAVRALSLTRSREGGGLRSIDFVNLGADELGSVYESLLELNPQYEDKDRIYRLGRRGHERKATERKATGSYYTSTVLVDCLLHEALDPLLDEACAKPTAEERVEALYNITVCDPACGSGHFLIAAARRIAKRVAIEKTGDPEPTFAAVRAALRLVVGRCIYGVDINPLAAEMARLSLCLEAIEPGKPLNFLEANIRVGNSLLGVTPRLLRDGIPDSAFDTLPLDEPRVASAVRRQNRFERSGGQQLPAPIGHTPLRQKTLDIIQALPDSLAELRSKQKEAYDELRKSPEWRAEEILANGWCAAFVQYKNQTERTTTITYDVLRKLAEQQGDIDVELFEGKIWRLATDYKFFHWHLEFPHIFWNGAEELNPDTGWTKGFSCVVGNPPWERLKPQEREFFASRHDDIANAPNAAARKRLIAALAKSDDVADLKLFAAWQRRRREAAAWTHLLSNSGRYPLTGRGDINTYAVFAETARSITSTTGRMGMVLPTGIATDATTARFFADLVDRSVLVSLLEFENEAFLLNRDVDHRVRFCLLTVSGRRNAIDKTAGSFAFGTRHIQELEGRRFAMPLEEIRLANPNTGTCPVFRSRRDAKITLEIYRRLPILWRDSPEENLWELSFMRMFDMATDSRRFRTSGQLEDAGWTREGNSFVKGMRRMLPLYEAKMIHHFNHRLGTYQGQTKAQAKLGTLPRLAQSQKDDQHFAITPRYWIAEESVQERLKDRWDRGFLLGWRDICRSTDERTMICSLIPVAAVGHKLPLALSHANPAYLATIWSSFILDYVARQKIAGTSMGYFVVKQLPVPSPDRYEEFPQWAPLQTLGSWMSSRIVELSYSNYEMKALADELRDASGPFRWDDERRAMLRAELDAAYFHLYGIVREDVEYVMDTFKVVRERDEKQFGEYRTKRLILEVFEAMDAAVRTGVPYKTIVDPPPGRGLRHPAGPM